MSHKELSRICAKCNITAADDEDLKFHRFPLPGKHGSLKARVWAKFCYPTEDWSTETSLRKLYQQHKMLCSKHFDETSYTSSAKTRLNNFAIPIGAQDLLIELRQEQCATLIKTPDVIIPVEKPEVIQEHFTTTSKILDANISVEVQVNTKTQTIEEVTPGPSSRITPTPLCLLAQTTGTESMVPTKGVLRELGLKSAELSPRKRNLYIKCRRNMSVIIRLRKKNKKRPRNLLPKLLADENVKSLMDNTISGSFALLLQNQLRNTSRKRTGRRWSIET